MNKLDAADYETLATSFASQIENQDLVGYQLREFAERRYDAWIKAFNNLIQIFDTINDRFETETKISINYLGTLSLCKIDFINEMIQQKAKGPPLITQDEVISNLISERPLLSYVALTTEIQGWLYKASKYSSEAPANLDIGNSDAVNVVRTNYLSFRNSFYSDQTAKYKDIISDLEAQIIVFKETAQKYDQTLLDKATSYDKTMTMVVDESALKWEEKFEAFRAAKDEENKIKKPVELWSNAATRHRRSFKASISMLILTISACALAVFYGISPLMKNTGLINPVSEKAESFTPASTLTLAMLIALITAAGFVLKVAGRVVTNSLTLAEDAEIRSALADTYLGLTAEEEGATSESRDKARTVMLAALFRPLPGHQQEEVVAPTVLSLAQDMLSKKGGGPGSS